MILKETYNNWNNIYVRGKEHAFIDVNNEHLDDTIKYAMENKPEYFDTEGSFVIDMEYGGFKIRPRRCAFTGKIIYHCSSTNEYEKGQFLRFMSSL
jgi:hypothetical protein